MLIHREYRLRTLKAFEIDTHGVIATAMLREHGLTGQLSRGRLSIHCGEQS